MAYRTGDATRKAWLKKISEKLVGRTIKAVDYLEAKEVDAAMWDKSAVVLILDNGESIWPSADDEGNGPGSLFTTIKELPIIPSI